MARWRLTESHYIYVEDIDGIDIVWEYKEIDDKGRQRRRTYPVPMHLDIKDAACYNDVVNGCIIVSDGVRPMPGDIIFKGPPTPAMAPIDEDAEAKTAEASKSWGNHPIESLSGQGFSQSLITFFEDQISAAQAKAATESKAPKASSIDPDEFKKMREQMAELMQANVELQAKLAEAPKAVPVRRA